MIVPDKIAKVRGAAKHFPKMDERPLPPTFRRIAGHPGRIDIQDHQPHPSPFKCSSR
jgi:hypothetical protein